MHERLEAEARARAAAQHVAASAISAARQAKTKVKELHRYLEASVRMVSDLRAACTAKEEEAREAKRALVPLKRLVAMLRSRDMAAALAGMNLGQSHRDSHGGDDDDADHDHNDGDGDGVGGVMPGAGDGMPRWGTAR